MSPQQIAAANEWAEHEYDAHFANQAQLTEMPESCGVNVLDDGYREQARHPWLRAEESAEK